MKRLTIFACFFGMCLARIRKTDILAGIAREAAVKAGIAVEDTVDSLLGKEPLWWTNAVIYQVLLSSFQDSDGDGEGDLRGVIQRLPYLKNIGVTTIMIHPPFTYPKHGHGYDLSKDREIDPVYGSMEDMLDLIEATHENGMHILIDFVPNRLSPQHMWFKMSVNREGKYTDYFIWSPAVQYDEDGDPVPPMNWVDINDRNIWIWNDEREEFYLAQAVEHVPVLQLQNPDVAREMMNNMIFWLNNGIDGFRVDALEFLCEERHFQKYIDKNPNWMVSDRTEISLDNNYYLPEKCHLAKIFGDKIGEYIKSDKRPRVVLVHSFGNVEEQVRHYHGEKIDGNPRFMLPINIHLLENINQGIQAMELKDLIESWLENLEGDNVANWIMADQATGRLASKVGREFVGPMNMLLMMLPGIAIVNMGQEIGMQNAYIRQDLSKDSYALFPVVDYWKESRDFYRTPMQWDSSTSAGFSTNRMTWLPVHPNYFSINVDCEIKATESNLRLFKAMTDLRQRSHTLKYGYTQVFTPDPYILVVKRFKWNHPSYILVINTDSVMREAYISGYGPHPEGDTVTVVLTSLYSNLKPGQNISGPLYQIKLLPKSAVLLKTDIWVKKKKRSSRSSSIKSNLDIVHIPKTE